MFSKKQNGEPNLGVKQCVWAQIAVKHFVMLELVVKNLERSFFHTALETRKKFGHEVVTLKPTIKFIYVLMTNIISVSMSSYKSM